MSDKKKYPAAVVDAFTDSPYSGNSAGVVFLGGDPFPADEVCIRIAAELRFSETAFIRKLTETEFALRYFTPVREAALCGHATVASFGFLREKKLCGYGDMLVHTVSGDIRATVGKSDVALDMTEAKTLFTLEKTDSDSLYRAFGLEPRGSVNGLVPKAVSVGLTDILLPVADLNELDAAIQDESAVSDISRKLNVTGVHMFCLTDDCFAAHCRNFAPLYGIPEECATGTSNGALFHYLCEYGLVKDEALFLQGEKMKRPSVIKALIEKGKVRVGGPSATVMEGTILV